MRAWFCGAAVLAVGMAGALGQAPAATAGQQVSAAAPQNDEAAQRAALSKANAAEQQRELEVLHLKATRPGVSGSANGANPANYDESRAGVTDANVLQPGTLPPVLQFIDGKPVRTARDWQRRRVELFQMFDQVELGLTPAKTPAVRWVLVSALSETRFGHLVSVKVLQGVLDNSAAPAIPVKIDLTLVTPVLEGSHSRYGRVGHVPVVMEFHWNFPAAMLARMPKEPGPPWQQQVLDRGWAYAEYSPYSVQPDNGAGLTAGVIGLVNHGRPRSVDEWGALKAWAWGASRAMDYLQSDVDVDATRVAIEGHSRFGKAALVAMAYDPRFAAAFVSSSGAGGADLWRRNSGEQLENVEGASEFHWEAGNLLKYAAEPLHAADLPIDQHELLALCAPRPVFISGGGEGDRWVDPHGMFLSAVAASPVWELLGARGLRDASGLVTAFPAIESPLVTGDLGFRQHTAGHTPGPNWPVFLEFAARHFGTPLTK